MFFVTRADDQQTTAMSLEAAIAWIHQTVGPTAAQQDAIALLEQANESSRHATLIVAPELTRNRRSYLARWAGGEFVVVELTAAQQAGLGVVSRGLLKDLHYPSKDCEARGESTLTLRDVQINSGDRHHRRQPLIGSCRYEFDSPQASPVSNVALRVQYFHPQLVRTLTNFAHSDRMLLPPGGEFPFSFAPLADGAIGDIEEGWFVLFLQMLTANNWPKMTGIQPVSNITAKLIELH
jgi:hypothetical protein